MSEEHHISALLAALGQESQRDAALQELWPLVYDELHRRAVRAMAREQVNHTLQPTALVHEAYLRLVRSAPLESNDRAHFLAIAAGVMRQVLVDHARKRDALRRGGDRTRVTLDEPQVEGQAVDYDAVDLHLALEKLEAVDARAAKVAEMRLFSGATVPEIAAALKLSARTVDNEWATARMWLHRALSTDQA